MLKIKKQEVFQHTLFQINITHIQKKKGQNSNKQIDYFIHEDKKEIYV